MFRKNTVVYCLFLGNCVAQIGWAENHKAHVHGEAKLVIAFESPTSLTFDLDSPGESIVGFEHSAKSKKDKKAMTAAFDRFKDKIAEVVRLDPALDCTFTVKEIGVEKGSEASHSDVAAEFSAQCKKSVIGSKAQFGILSLFPKMKKLRVQVLKETGQTEKVITKSDESIEL